MNLDEKKVLIPRSNLIKQWNNKEWWYCGVFDPDLEVYLSFFFIRVNIIDNFSITIFDPSMDKPTTFTKSLYLNSYQEKNALSLNYSGKGLKVGFNGDEKKGWKFEFNNNQFSVDLDMTSTAPAFTKFNNYFEYWYTLLHNFHILTKGTIKTPDKTYGINKGLCYYDHCFGNVPSKSGWHWFAGQNEDVSISSLTNYGPKSQKYTQIYFKKCEKDIPTKKWIRLNEDVSFEYDPDNKIKGSWKVTSPDMDIEVTPIMHSCDINKIPSFLPFMINITHHTFFAKANGSVRIDNQWVDIGNIYGVLEEHYGKW